MAPISSTWQNWKSEQGSLPKNVLPSQHNDWQDVAEQGTRPSAYQIHHSGCAHIHFIVSVSVNIAIAAVFSEELHVLCYSKFWKWVLCTNLPPKAYFIGFQQVALFVKYAKVPDKHQGEFSANKMYSTLVKTPMTHRPNRPIRLKMPTCFF